MPVLSFPFRVDPVHRTGPGMWDSVDSDPMDVPPREVASVQDGSDREITEAVAAHIMVQTEERPMRPDFGTESLPFGPGLSQGALQLQLAEHGWAHVLVSRLEPDDPREDGYRQYRVGWMRTL